MTFAIETIGLGKRFSVSQGYRDLLPWRRRRDVPALEEVSLQIRRGEIFGILGPNGAGKTTLFKILATLILPTTGQARVMGLDVVEDPAAVKGLLTYMTSDERTLYWRLTGRQNLRFFAMLNEIPRRQREQRIGEVLSIVGLSEEADERVVKYSTGTKQKLAIARGLLADPEIILLDEPTRSLDPLSARRIQTFIKEELKDRKGKTIVLATHNMEEASYLCDRVAILHRGKVRACDTVATIGDRLTEQGRFTITIIDPGIGIARGLLKLPGVLGVQETSPNGHGAFSLDVIVKEATEHIPFVVEYMVRSGAKVVEVSRVTASLSDAIAALVEEPIDPKQTVGVPVERLGAGT